MKVSDTFKIINEKYNLIQHDLFPISEIVFCTNLKKSLSEKIT